MAEEEEEEEEEAAPAVSSGLNSLFQIYACDVARTMGSKGDFIPRGQILFSPTRHSRRAKINVYNNGGNLHFWRPSLLNKVPL